MRPEVPVTHLFFIHSSICVEMMKRIVNYLGLKDNEIFILNSRNIKGIPNKFKSVDLNNKFDYFPFFTLKYLISFKWLLTPKVVKLWDHIIENEVNAPFIFYAQNGRHYKYRIISSNSNCIGVNYFEDGIDFYMTFEEFVKKYPNPLRIRYKLINYILGNFLGVYNRIRQDKDVFPSFNESTRLFVLNRNTGSHLAHILPDRVILNSQSLGISFQLPHNSILICFSALAEQGVANNEDMMKGYIDVLNSRNFISSRTLFLRFHPAQSMKSRVYILETLSGWNVSEMSDDLIIEEFIADQNSEFILMSCGSSVLMYASLLSSKVKCFAIYKSIEKHSGYTRRSSQWRNTLKGNNKNLFIWN